MDRRAWFASACRYLTASASPSPIVSFCLLVLLLSSYAFAQQDPPLRGQGIDPVTLGLVDAPLPVYMSVELVKLLKLDEQEYQFYALLDFQYSWTDPRAYSWVVITTVNDKEFVNENNNLTLKCVNTTFEINMSSPECEAVMQQAPPCNKYCSTYGTTTDNPWRCCDVLWLPGFSLRNQIDYSQDRMVRDDLIPIPLVNDTGWGWMRRTRILARFSTALHFERYPFDTQRLSILVDTASSVYTNESAFYIVPSATFRRLNQEFEVGANHTGSVSALNHNELAGWNIGAFTFACTDNSALQGGSKGRPISEQTQPFDPNDIYNNLYASYYHHSLDANKALKQTCALTISLSRLSSTAVVQSILPVAFIGALSFGVYFTEVDALDLRLGTEVTLFLALTAVQFVFAGVLPLATKLTAFDVFILISYCVVIATATSSVALSTYLRKAEQVQEQQQKSWGAEQQALVGKRPGDSQEAALTHVGKSTEGYQDQLHEVGAGQEDGAAPADAQQLQGEGSHSLYLCSAFVCAGLDREALTKPGPQAKPPHYRFAQLIDTSVGIVLFLAYVSVSVLNFTVGFN